MQFHRYSLRPATRRDITFHFSKNGGFLNKWSVFEVFFQPHLPVITGQSLGSAPVAEIPKLSKVVPVARLKQGDCWGNLSPYVTSPVRFTLRNLFFKVDTWLTPETLLDGRASPRRSGTKPPRAQRRISIIHDLLRRAAGFQRALGTLVEHDRNVKSNRTRSLQGVAVTGAISPTLI